MENQRYTARGQLDMAVLAVGIQEGPFVGDKVEEMSTVQVLEHQEGLRKRVVVGRIVSKELMVEHKALEETNQSPHLEDLHKKLVEEHRVNHSV